MTTNPIDRLDAAAGVWFFTDGMTEAHDERDEMFGDDALVELVESNVSLGATALCDEILAAVKRHARGEVQDDVTLLVVAVDAPA